MVNLHLDTEVDIVVETTLRQIKKMIEENPQLDNYQKILRTKRILRNRLETFGYTCAKLQIEKCSEAITDPTDKRYILQTENVALDDLPFLN